MQTKTCKQWLVPVPGVLLWAGCKKFDAAEASAANQQPQALFKNSMNARPELTGEVDFLENSLREVSGFAILCSGLQTGTRAQTIKTCSAY
jgi:hypothetical protein